MKSPLERKKIVEDLLLELEIPINKNLPLIESEEETQIRNPDEIAKRVLVLSYLNIIIETGEKEKVVQFMKKSGLWKDLSPNERQILNKKEISEQEKINISWQSEAMWIMLWSLNKIDSLDLPTDQCEVKEIVNCLPKYLKSFDDFTTNAKLRNKSEILNQSDLIYRLHWAVRDARRNNKEIPANLNQSVIQEWHWAINWITNYNELNWDEVTTDT